MPAALDLLIVEDHAQLRPALAAGLEATGQVRVRHACASGEEALDWLTGAEPAPAAALLDVQLAGAWDGLQTALALRHERPRLPVVFYSIQDDDAYFRAFRQAGFLTHYAYVRKSNDLLPAMLVPLLRDAVSGRSFIDPEIAARVQAVRHKDEHAPFALLEPNEQAVARLLAQGLTNDQIAARLGFKDKRTISRVNGQIYAAWGLDVNATDEKVARTRAALIAAAGRWIQWDAHGQAVVLDERGGWSPWAP